ncbi:MAG: hypothetical protein KDC46_00175 [Thermoleophilia bacterium]|nr:hypothetical protein [Thermoleophilia bacterium]
MTTTTTPDDPAPDPTPRRETRPSSSGAPAGGGGAVYGFGLIGAAVYYVRFADGFWDGALGLLKALVWPALLVYEALKGLGA